MAGVGTPVAQRCRATPNCPGLILDGFCALCGRRAGAPTSPTGADRATGSRSSASRLTTGSAPTGTSTTLARTTRWSSGVPVVELPYMPTVDPTEAILATPLVPEEKRFCSGCNARVGRTLNGRPGRVSGYCSKCRTPYSFSPALAADDLLAQQYRVLGCLAYGGMGWIYLAQDERVSNRWVVLKGVLNARDPAAVAAALAERQFLARVEHPNVVRIYNAVEHVSGGYIVMEYIGGRTLKSVLVERRLAGEGPLPVDIAIAYMLAVLPAFRYLHDIGLAYNDFKPDNVMLQGGEVKLIDLGAVTRMGDPNPILYGTDGYQAPEMGTHGPSAAADLYSIARCVAVLVLDLQAYQTTYRHRLPTPEDAPLFKSHESLYRFLMKATAHDFRDRYQSADEMANALEAVLREVTAGGQGGPRPVPSKLFGGDVLSIRWAAGGADPGPDWRHLPAPRVDPADASAGHVLSALVLEPPQRVAALREALAHGLIQATVEAQLALTRGLVELGQHAQAETVLAQLESTDRREWRGNWYRGLSLLAQGRAAEAGLAFELVYGELPGEPAPRLALALAAEVSGDIETAARHYDIVSSTDPGFTTASFGLARAREAQGDLAGVVRAYERVPPTSNLHAPAQLALARALIRGGSAAPTVDDLVRASSVIERFQVGEKERAELGIELFEAALALVLSGAPINPPEAQVLGQPLRQVPLRFALERAYRELAWLASGEERVHLVECANEVRPMTGL
jgi:serine/threonine-protein kinase PknG